MSESNIWYGEEHSKTRGMGGPARRWHWDKASEEESEPYTYPRRSFQAKREVLILSLSSVWCLEKPQRLDQSEQGRRKEGNEIRRGESRVTGCPGHGEGFGHPGLECRSGLSPLSLHSPSLRGWPSFLLLFHVLFCTCVCLINFLRFLLEYSRFTMLRRWTLLIHPTLHFIQSPPPYLW